MTRLRFDTVPVNAALGVIPKKDKRQRNLELARKLYATNGRRIIETIIAKALDPKDPDQMQALKLCVDRVAPVSFFDKVAAARSAYGVQVFVNTVQPHVIEDRNITTIEGEIVS